MVQTSFLNHAIEHFGRATNIGKRHRKVTRWVFPRNHRCVFVWRGRFFLTCLFCHYSDSPGRWIPAVIVGGLGFLSALLRLLSTSYSVSMV